MTEIDEEFKKQMEKELEEALKPLHDLDRRIDEARKKEGLNTSKT